MSRSVIKDLSMLPYRPLVFCSTLLAAVLSQSSGSDGTISIDGWIANTQEIKSAAAKKALSDFRKEVSDLDADYAKGFEKSRSVLNTRLDKARAEATKNDKPDDAIKIRESMDELKQVKVARVGKSKTPDVAINGDLRIIVGRWEGSWGTTGNQLLVTITEDGTLVYQADRLKLAMQNNRLLAVGGQHQNFELIPSGTRLIVLGWTMPTQRNPLTDQPDHVAILTRGN
jgi:hypothetical protein